MVGCGVLVPWCCELLEFCDILWCRCTVVSCGVVLLLWVSGVFGLYCGLLGWCDLLDFCSIAFWCRDLLRCCCVL